MEALCRIEMASDSGLGEDRFTNSFVFEGLTSVDVASAAQIAIWADQFWNASPPGGLTPLAQYLSPEVSNAPGGMVVKIYDITGRLAGGALVGSPIYTTSFQVGAASGAPAGLPAEVAVCLTLEGFGRAAAAVETADGPDPGPERDRPRQRRTGRVFLGPLNTLVLSTVDGQTRPASNIRDTSRLALKNFAEGVQLAVVGARMGVWSRRNAAVYPLVACSVDNAFDTVRSRGPASTLRQRTTIF